MKLNRSLLVAAVVIVVVVCLVGGLLAVPQWSLVLGAAVLLVLAAGIFRPREDVVASIPVVPQQPVMLEEQAPLPTPSRAVADIRLPSADEDYDFVFAAAVYWTPAGAAARHADLSSVAVNALLERARKIVAGRKPGDASQTQHLLASVLGYAEIDEGRQVRTWAEKVGLRLPDQDAEHLRRLVAMKRKRQMIELERELERDLRAYLKDEVLATPGSAAVWWFAQHPDQVEKAVELYPTLSRLSAAANDQTDPVQLQQFMVSVQDQLFFSAPDGTPAVPLIAGHPLNGTQSSLETGADRSTEQPDPAAAD